MAQAGRNIWLLVAFFFSFEICIDYLDLDEAAVLESSVVIFFVACLVGFRFAELPSWEKTEEAARSIFSIIDQASLLDSRVPSLSDRRIRFG